MLKNLNAISIDSLTHVIWRNPINFHICQSKCQNRGIRLIWHFRCFDRHLRCVIAKTIRCSRLQFECVGRSCCQAKYGVVLCEDFSLQLDKHSVFKPTIVFESVACDWNASAFNAWSPGKSDLGRFCLRCIILEIDWSVRTSQQVSS